MILDIKPITHDHAPCTETVYINVCNYFQKNYELMFAGSWGFAFKPEKGIAEEGSIEYYEGDYWMNPNVEYALKKFNDILIDVFYPDTSQEAYKVITSQISKGFPVGIYMDTYWCPWSVGYKLDNIEHYCLVIGIDNNLKKMYCIDSYFSQSIYELPFENYDKGFEKCFLFSRVENPQPNVDYKEMVDFIRSDMKKKVEGNTFSDIVRLAKFISELKDMDVFFGDYYESYTKNRNNVNIIPIFRMINNVSCSRKNYARVLKFIYNHYNKFDLLETAKVLELCSEKWSAINSLFMRALMSKGKRLFTEKIAEKINEVALLEKESAISFLKDINNMNI